VHDRAVLSRTRGHRWRRTGLVAGLFAALAALAPLASATPAPQVTLKIEKGEVTVTGSRLKGSATVGNGGAGVSRRFFVDLIVQLNGPDRLLRRTAVERLGTGDQKRVAYNLNLPTTLPIGNHPIWACVAHSGALPEPSVLIGCHEVGSVDIPVPRLSPAPSPAPAPTTPPVTPPASPLPPTPPLSTVPTAPIAFEAEMPEVVNDADNGYYWVDVPSSYDRSNQTPTTLFVWLHGCGGLSSGDIYTVSPETVGPEERPRDWISIAVGGTDEGCWEPNTQMPLVTNAIADVETHFNIDRHRVILGGYSSGGDLAYRLAFYDADQFAGLLAENTSPFRDTGSTEAASLAAAAWKFNVVHLAHLQDEEYPIAGVRQETDAMIADGFPLQRIEVDGGHYDEPGEIENGHRVPGTDADLVNLLLPHIDDGWRSP
jgi:pimeloyl-ACP methyl ester carboxylesterase